MEEVKLSSGVVVCVDPLPPLLMAKLSNKIQKEFPMPEPMKVKLEVLGEGSPIEEVLVTDVNHAKLLAKQFPDRFGSLVDALKITNQKRMEAIQNQAIALMQATFNINITIDDEKTTENGALPYGTSEWKKKLLGPFTEKELEEPSSYMEYYAIKTNEDINAINGALAGRQITEDDLARAESELFSNTV